MQQRILTVQQCINLQALESNQKGYCHYVCAVERAQQLGTALQPPVCKHWARQGTCLAGGQLLMLPLHVLDGL